jgi:molybdopterin-binding protein
MCGHSQLSRRLIRKSGGFSCLVSQVLMLYIWCFVAALRAVHCGADTGLTCPRMSRATSGTSTPPRFRDRTCGGILRRVPHYRMSEVAELFGVSDDTVRRWADSGQLTAIRDAGGRKAVDGVELAAFAKSQAHATPDPSVVDRSARNRFVGLATEVIADRVMAQVEIQCGPHRVVSLMSSEAVRELGLVPGVLAVAVVKSTQIMVETPGGRG